MDGVGDGGFGKLVASAAPDNELPRQAIFHVLEHVGDKDARALESHFAVTDLRVRHHVFTQINSPRASFHGFNLTRAQSLTAA